MKREEVLKLVKVAHAEGKRADLRGANLRYADLRYADLRGVNLYGVDLYGADLLGADLLGADLRGANLHDAYWRGLQVNGLPSGSAVFYPTSKGWFTRIGCWSGTLDDLETLVSSDKGWPEARGEEIERRRPFLKAFIDMARANEAYWPDAVEELRKRWESDSEEQGQE